MYKLTDIVEMGHTHYTGGSIEIGIEFDSILQEKKKKEILNIIDYLDHCLVTDNKEYIQYSARYFLLKKCNNIFTDIRDIISYFIDYKSIKIKLGKEECILSDIKLNNILLYNKEDKNDN